MRRRAGYVAAAGLLCVALVVVWQSFLPLSASSGLPRSPTVLGRIRQHTQPATDAHRAHHLHPVHQGKKVETPSAAVSSTGSEPSSVTPSLAVPAGPARLDEVLNVSAYAYAFYATSDQYACGVLVNIDRLQTTFNSPIPIHVLASTAVSSPFIAAFEQRRAVVHIEAPPPLSHGAGGYYRDCLLKLLAFKLHRLSPGLRRVLAFDSDQLIMRNLDHLFTGLPDVDLAAPRAYWLAKDFLSSTFLMIKLSDRLWSTVRGALDSVGHNKFDMDLINDLLGDTVMMLSGEYITLNSHWEDWNLPTWFHPETEELNLTTVEQWNRLVTQQRVDSNAGMDRARSRRDDGAADAPSPQPPVDMAEALMPTTADDDVPLAAETYPIMRIGDKANPYSINMPDHSLPAAPTLIPYIVPDTALAPPPPMPDSVVMTGPRFPQSHPIHKELYRLQDAAAVIHFTALGKPWNVGPEAVAGMKPDAHPSLGVQFALWRKVATEVCPAVA